MLNNSCSTKSRHKEVIWKYATKKKTQTILKDQFSLGWTTNDTTGMIENEQKTWIHPPRHNQYTMNEIAPFPEPDEPLHEIRNELFV